MSRRAAVLVAGGLLLLGLAGLAAWRSGAGRAAWMAAYPHLPRRAQALPYRIRAALPGSEATPVPLPTAPSSAGAGGPDLIGQDGAGAPDADAATPRLPGTVVRPAAATTSPASPSPASPPTASPTLVPSPEATSMATSAAIALPPLASVAALRHEHQTWNNCGPATISMALSGLGDDGDQRIAATRLKPDPDDKNVSPDELARYARERGYEAIVRRGADRETLMALLAAGLPVIIETWFIPDPNDEMGHYRVLTGYDEQGEVFFADDSYEGPGLVLEWEPLDALWRGFDRQLVVAWPPERRTEVEAILGDLLDDRVMYTRAAARAQREIEAGPDAFGYYNLGANLQGLGDPARAAEAFDRAREIGLPWRLLWYRFEIFETYAALGRWEDVRALADANLRNAPNLEESLYWRGRAKSAAGDEAGARADFERALRLNPLYAPARDALEAAP